MGGVLELVKKPGTPDEGLISELEELLDKARKGEIETFIVAYDTSKRDNWHSTWGGNSTRLLYILGRLQHGVHLLLDEDDQK